MIGCESRIMWALQIEDIRCCQFSDRFLHLFAIWIISDFNFELYLWCAYSPLSDQLSADSVGLARPSLYRTLYSDLGWHFYFWIMVLENFYYVLSDALWSAESRQCIHGKVGSSCYDRRPWALARPPTNTPYPTLALPGMGVGVGINGKWRCAYCRVGSFSRYL